LVLTRLAKQRLLPVSTKDGQVLAKRINAKYFIETSSKTRAGVEDVFECAANQILKDKHPISKPSKLKFPKKFLTKEKKKKCFIC
jgi:GTPase SAR1 family protein